MLLAPALLAPALLAPLLVAGCGSTSTAPSAPSTAASPLEHPVSGDPVGFVLALSGNLDGEIEPCG